MTQLHLPNGCSDHDRVLAERVAAGLGLRELTVCHVAPSRRVRSMAIDRVAAPSPAGGLIAELAIGVAFLVNALVDAVSQRARVAR
ncbi:MAG TPA: hypothetical protein VHE14_06465 [Solirubrobacteraceae bacterium]|nr:hypothetical protein [Solirubrobacteraceae bacterium]